MGIEKHVAHLIWSAQLTQSIPAESRYTEATILTHFLFLLFPLQSLVQNAQIVKRKFKSNETKNHCQNKYKPKKNQTILAWKVYLFSM